MFYHLTPTLTIVNVLYFLVFSLFCVIDLRTRKVGVIWIFLAGALILSAMQTPARSVFVIAAIAWSFATRLTFLLVPLLFYPPIWPVLLWGYGYSSSPYPPIIDKADLLTMASIASLYAWPATVCCVLGFQAWRLWWCRRYRKDTHLPGLPGFLVGLTIYILGDILLSQYGAAILGLFKF